jgi:membrane protein
MWFACTVGWRGASLKGMQGVDPTTERTDHGAEFRNVVLHHAYRAKDLGEHGLRDSLRFTDKVRIAYWNAFQHDCMNTAKATAYSAIFAIFPALGVAMAFITLLPYTAPVRSQLQVFLDRVLPEAVAPLFENFFNTTHDANQSTGVLLGAAFVSVSGASGVLSTLMEGFRRAYNLTDECWGRGWRGQVRQYAQSYLLVPILLVPLAITSVAVIFGHFMLLELMRMTPAGWDAGLYWTANAVRWIGSLSATAGVLACIYRFAVPVRPSWRNVLPGAAFATATWFLSTVAFGWYVTRFAHYSRVYGSLGTGVVLLVWLFLTSLTVLCGAELNAELARDEQGLRTGTPACAVPTATVSQ